MNEIFTRVTQAELSFGPSRVRHVLAFSVYRDRVRIAFTSIAWSPTIAMSWLWGLGFFYSIHVTIEDGWLGFLCFAAPNAAGLFVFGWILGDKRLNPANILTKLQAKYCGLFLITQVLALALTIFGFAAYLWRPMVSATGLLPIGLIIVVGCGVGQVSSAKTLKRLHLFYLLLGVGAALFALSALRSSSLVPSSLGSLTGRFSGLLIPLIVGLLLGPWMDLQQWQRAIDIRAEGGSVRASYAGGSVLFFALLALNALLAATCSSGGQIISADGIADKAPAVALAIASTGLRGAAAAYATWAAIAAISTIDSSYVATGWMMKRITANSNSPVFAFISPKMISSPLWVVLAAVAVASGVIRENLSIMYLMAPFATILAGVAVSLVAEALGAPGRSDLTFAGLTGLAGALVLLYGYVHNVPALETIAPFIALIGGAPVIASLFKGSETSAPVEQQGVRRAADQVEKERPAHSNCDAPAAPHSFDGQWFQIRLTPTYDDTNSVGNIYFANYVRWVGKARELFFNACMPNFELSTTTFYVLTKSFQHEFRREAKEFEDAIIRLCIARHSRKFVILQHEIISAKHGLLGHGEQSLMFVDAKTFRPLDIPRSIIEGFLPFWPKTSPHRGARREIEPSESMAAEDI